MPSAIKQRRRSAEVARGKNGSDPRDAAEFAAGSLEAELSAIGKVVPVREWAKVPADYFANLDHYLHGLPKKKCGWSLQTRSIGVQYCIHLMSTARRLSVRGRRLEVSASSRPTRC